MSCPEDSASFLSKITFWWFTGMILKGYKHPLTTHDMWTLNRKNISNVILTKFNKVWIPTVEKEKQNAKRKVSLGEPVVTDISLLSSILKTFWPGMLFVSFIKFIASTLTFVNPLVLDRLISFMSPSNDEPQWRGYFYASLMFISPLFKSLLNSQYEYRINLMTMRIRACLISVIYEKVCYLLLWFSSLRIDLTII
jgi:ABC-type bacteriocin/lantibiotic exporter with double-glycine peptidase domain